MKGLRGITAPLVKGVVFILVTGLTTGLLAISIANTGVGDTVGYQARFTDVTSLNPGDDVRISGVRVGQVDKLTVVDGDAGSVALVHFSVNAERRLPAGVTAAIRYRNLVGQRYIALDRGAGAGGRSLPPGGEIPLQRTTPALDLTELFNGFKPLFQALSPTEVNQLSGELIQVLQGEGGTVASLLAHTGSLTATLAGRDEVIGQVISNLNSVLTTINERDDDLTALVGTLQQLVSGLAEDRTAIGAAIGGMADLTTATAGLLEVARPPLKDSIAGLAELSGNLAAGSPELVRFLTLLPAKFEAIGRAGSYGSWLNFYLCSAVLETDPEQGLPVTAERCRT